MKIFVVDDDATARLLVVDALHGLGHDIHELGTATALLEAVDQHPDLVLLDIEMPEMDGIRACGALRQRDVHQPQVMFVSSHDDLDSRLAAYDAGGNDFIVKPFTPQELVQKVQNAAALLTQRTELAARASFAQATAFTAMASMGEMGKVLHFLRASFACQEADQLSRALLDTLHEFDLPGLVQIRLLDEIRCLSSQGECTPLECSILSHAAGMDRIFQFRDRLVLNYPGLTLVAQNLPLDDADRVGRLRDHLALLAEGASEKVQALIHEKQRQAQSGVIRNAVAELSQTLLAIEGHQAQTRMHALEIDTAYQEELVSAFVHLGLTDAQENALAGMAERHHLQLANLLDEEYVISDRLRAVAEQLRQLGAMEAGTS